MIEPEWEIEVTPGQTIKTQGTVQQVHNEVLKHNPNWDEEYLKPALNKRDNDPTLAKRTDFYGEGSISCNTPWEKAGVPYINNGIDYLRGLDGSGRPSAQPGPSVCARVSCSYNAAIWWCNDVHLLS